MYYCIALNERLEAMHKLRFHFVTKRTSYIPKKWWVKINGSQIFKRMLYVHEIWKLEFQTMITLSSEL